MKCRFCNHCIETIFVDLANSPPSNSYLTLEQLSLPEIYYPLKVMVCENCFLVQIDKYKKPTEIFNNNYAYFSSYSTSWLEHCMNYVEFMIEEFNLNLESKVIEISSNDGYLLKYFKDDSKINRSDAQVFVCWKMEGRNGDVVLVTREYPTLTTEST